MSDFELNRPWIDKTPTKNTVKIVHNQSASDLSENKTADRVDESILINNGLSDSESARTFECEDHKGVQYQQNESWIKIDGKMTPDQETVSN